MARLGWVVGAGAGLTLFIAGIAPTFAALHMPCASITDQDCSAAQLYQNDIQALGSAAVNTYAIYALVVLVAASLVFFAVAGLIAWRKWNDPTGLVYSLVLITFAATGVSNTFIPSSNVVLLIATYALVILQYPLLAAFLVTFPTGHFAPRWTVIFVPIWLAQTALFLLAPPYVVLDISSFLTWGAVGAVQLYRYVRLYTPMQRHGWSLASWW